MKKIYIVGGDGFARECFDALKYSLRPSDNACFGGFLGHRGHTLEFKECDELFLGDVAEHAFKKDEYAVIGVGLPALRKLIFTDLKKQGVPLYNLVGKGSFIGSGTQMGEGNIFISSAITSGGKIGDGNLFNGEVLVGHDCDIGNFNFFCPRSNILGGGKIGDENTIGTGSVILPGAKIGNANKIAPLSAVYRGCKNNAYLLGNPALKVGDVPDAPAD